MKRLKKIIIGILVCTFGIILLIIPFLKKNKQTPKKIGNQSNKKKISNNFRTSKTTDQKVSSKKTFFFFIIIGIIIIILLIIWLVKNYKYKAFLSKRCYCLLKNEIKIYFGAKKINDSGNTMFFIKDIGLKQFNFDFYKTLANDQNLLNSLIAFYYLVTNFFFQINGYLLKACYDSNNNSNTPLTQMSKKFNEKILVNQTKNGMIFKIIKSKATRPLSEEEIKLFENKKYVDLFKTIMQQDNIPYYKDKIKQLPLFKHCHSIYTTIKILYDELTTFFNKEENKKHRNKYKTAIDDKMNKINNFLKIQQVKNSPS